MPGKGIYGIVGKTIERVIVKKHKDDRVVPAIQVFLIFTDGTHYELYSADRIGFSGSVDVGGRDKVLGYMSDVMEVVYEGFLGEGEKPTWTQK